MVLKVYEKPIIYLLIHVGLGIVAAWVNWLAPAMLLYQATQLVLNRRFFLFEMRVREGNNVKHTAIKLIEFFIGYAIGSTL